MGPFDTPQLCKKKFRIYLSSKCFLKDKKSELDWQTMNMSVTSSLTRIIKHVDTWPMSIFGKVWLEHDTHKSLHGFASSSTLPCLNFINNFLDSTQFSTAAPALSYLPTRSDYLEKRELVAVSIKTLLYTLLQKTQNYPRKAVEQVDLHIFTAQHFFCCLYILTENNIFY